MPAVLALLAQRPAASPAEGHPPASPALLLLTSMGEQDARLAGWGPAGPVLDGMATPADWLEIRFPGAPAVPAVPAAAAPAAWEVELAHGVCLPGTPIGGDERHAFWRLPSGLELRFDSLWLRRLGAGGLRRPAPADQDLLWLRGPEGGVDRRSGWMVGWRDTGLDFEDQSGAHVHPWGRVLALQLVQEEVPEWDGGVWIVLQQGGHLLARVESLESGQLRLAVPWGDAWTVPLAQVAALRRRGAPLEALAERAPLRSRGPDGPVLDWSPRLGRSVEGRALRVAGMEFATGFGTHAPAEVVVAVPGPGRFAARVGVDDETLAFRSRAVVRFRVLWGDEELAQAQAAAGQAPQFLRAEVPGAGELRLLCEPLEEVAAGAHGDWLDPVFVPASLVQASG